MCGGVGSRGRCRRRSPRTWAQSAHLPAARTPSPPRRGHLVSPNTQATFGQSPRHAPRRGSGSPRRRCLRPPALGKEDSKSTAPACRLKRRPVWAATACTAALAVAGVIAPLTPADAVTDVTKANGSTFTIHDSHRPARGHCLAWRGGRRRPRDGGRVALALFARNRQITGRSARRTTAPGARLRALVAECRPRPPTRNHVAVPGLRQKATSRCTSPGVVSQLHTSRTSGPATKKVCAPNCSASPRRSASGTRRNTALASTG